MTSSNSDHRWPQLDPTQTQSKSRSAQTCTAFLKRWDFEGHEPASCNECSKHCPHANINSILLCVVHVCIHMHMCVFIKSCSVYQITPMEKAGIQKTAYCLNWKINRINRHLFDKILKFQQIDQQFYSLGSCPYPRQHRFLYFNSTVFPLFCESQKSLIECRLQMCLLQTSLNMKSCWD